MRYRFTKNEIGIRKNNEGSWVLSIMLDGHLVECAYMFYSKEAALRKFQGEFGTYPDSYTPLGVLTLNNFGGLAIMEIDSDIDDYVIVCDNYGDGYKNISKCRIYYNAKGYGYFTRNKKRYYINEFMRV